MLKCNENSFFESHTLFETREHQPKNNLKNMSQKHRNELVVSYEKLFETTQTMESDIEIPLEALEYLQTKLTHFLIVLFSFSFE